jgi:hypothetical protein
MTFSRTKTVGLIFLLVTMVVAACSNVPLLLLQYRRPQWLIRQHRLRPLPRSLSVRSRPRLTVAPLRRCSGKHETRPVSALLRDLGDVPGQWRSFRQPGLFGHICRYPQWDQAEAQRLGARDGSILQLRAACRGDTKPHDRR